MYEFYHNGGGKLHPKFMKNECFFYNKNLIGGDIFFLFSVFVTQNRSRWCISLYFHFKISEEKKFLILLGLDNVSFSEKKKIIFEKHWKINDTNRKFKFMGRNIRQFERKKPHNQRRKYFLIIFEFMMMALFSLKDD